MKTFRTAWLWLGTLAALWSCSGGSGGPIGGPVDGPGNYAAGPVSLPAPTTLNKDLIYCVNVAGPRVECYGNDGAAPPNAHLKLTVYSRFSAASKSLLDYLIPSAQALVGDTDFCDANSAGAFGQGGECSVVAAAGEKVGICVVDASNVCAGPEVVLIMGAEGTTVQGSTAVIKSFSTDPADGSIIYGKKSLEESAKPSKWSWTSLLWGTAHAGEPPLLHAPDPVPAACFDSANPVIDLRPSSTESILTLRRLDASDVDEPLLRVAGFQQESLNTLFPYFASDGLRKIFAGVDRDLLIFSEDSPGNWSIEERFRFPYPVRKIEFGLFKSAQLQVILDGPETANNVYAFGERLFAGEGYSAFCGVDSELTGLKRFVSSTFTFAACGATSNILGVGFVAEFNDFRVISKTTDCSGYAGESKVVYNQAAPLASFVSLELTDTRWLYAVLDMEAKRILFFKQVFGTGSSSTVEMSEIVLGSAVNFPVSMVFSLNDAGSGGMGSFLAIADSGELGAKVLFLPVTISAGGASATLTGAKALDLGAVVINSLEELFNGLTSDGTLVTSDLSSRTLLKINVSEAQALP